MPTPALLPFVKRFVIVEFPLLKLLPDTGFVAEFRFRGENALDGGAYLPRAALSGLWDIARTRIYTGGSAILLVMFTEMGAVAFLRDSLDTFLNTTTSIGKVLGVLGPASELGVLDEQLAGAKDHAQRIQIADSFLL